MEIIRDMDNWFYIHK